MRSFLRFNPALCSVNLGDHIIVDSILKQMDFLFADNYCVDVSSHQPVSFMFTHRVLVGKEMSFVLGSNLLQGRLNSVYRQWKIHLFNAKLLGPTVLIGVGWRQYNEPPNLYTRSVYRKILSHTYMHSVRDSYTESMMRKMGFDNVINTGCATMWFLTPDFCEKIPTQKGRDVVFTITDYLKDYEKDKKMISILLNNYENVYAWMQGMDDYKYYKELVEDEKRIKLVQPTLEAYDKFLNENESVDYVGTRLHGGIRALQHKKRTVILGIDNRATEKKKDFNLPVMDRSEIHNLTDIINTPFITDIKIPLENINKWKEQFKK